MEKACFATAVNLIYGFRRNDAELLDCLKNAGFDGFFPDWRDAEQVCEVAKLGRQRGLAVQSVHASFGYMHRIWEPEEEGDEALADLICCAEACSEAEVPIMVAHAFIGFGEQHPNMTGIERLSRLLDRAEKLGVRVAFENTEGEKYLEYIDAKLRDKHALCYCLDVGHEMCYNNGRDMTALYREKLTAIHLNDNFGVTGEKITYLDDAHVLPFDGIVNWESAARRITRTGFSGLLTFELNRSSKPGRDTHGAYADWTAAEFYRMAYARAVRVCELFKEAGFVQKK